MPSNTNLINYETLEEAARVYSERAQEIQELTAALVSQNGILQEGWQNLTAESFIERFEEEYRPNLEKTEEALESIANFIREYVRQQQEQDQDIASGIRI